MKAGSVPSFAIVAKQALARKRPKPLADGGPRPSGRGILAKESKGARPSASMDYGQLSYL